MKLRSSWLLIIAVGVLIRFFYIFLPAEKLITIIPDDAFYYFKISKNIVSGLGSSFDTVSLTNGYHPLWMLTLLPFSWLIKNPWVFVRTTLALSTFISAITALTAYLFLKIETKNTLLSATGVILYFLNPLSMANNLNGLETSLSSLLIMILIYIVGTKKGEKKFGWWMFLGLVFALTFLSRTDTIFYLTAFWGYVFYQERKTKKLFQKMTVFCFSFAATVLPWFLWNTLKLKTIFQSSTDSVPFVLKNHFLLNNPDGSVLKNGLKISYQFFGKDLLPTMGFSYLWAVVFIILTTWLFFKNRKPIKLPKEFFLLFWLIMAGFSLAFTHSFWRWYPRPWYFDQLILVLSLFISRAISILFRKDKKSQIVLAIFLISLTVANSRHLFSLNPYPHQIEMYQASLWIKENTTTDKTIASFNSGIIGYFSERRTINLDGVVNQNAYLALKEKTLWDFVEETNAEYYLDYDPFMISLYHPFLGDSFSETKLSLVKTVDEPNISWQENNLKVYQINKSK